MVLDWTISSLDYARPVDYEHSLQQAQLLKILFTRPDLCALVRELHHVPAFMGGTPVINQAAMLTFISALPNLPRLQALSLFPCGFPLTVSQPLLSLALVTTGRHLSTDAFNSASLTRLELYTKGDVDLLDLLLPSTVPALVDLRIELLSSRSWASVQASLKAIGSQLRILHLIERKGQRVAAAADDVYFKDLNIARTCPALEVFAFDHDCSSLSFPGQAHRWPARSVDVLALGNPRPPQMSPSHLLALLVAQIKRRRSPLLEAIHSVRPKTVVLSGLDIAREHYPATRGKIMQSVRLIATIFRLLGDVATQDQYGHHLEHDPEVELEANTILQAGGWHPDLPAPIMDTVPDVIDSDPDPEFSSASSGSDEDPASYDSDNPSPYYAGF